MSYYRLGMPYTSILKIPQPSCTVTGLLFQFNCRHVPHTPHPWLGAYAADEVVGVDVRTFTGEEGVANVLCDVACGLLSKQTVCDVELGVEYANSCFAVVSHSTKYM